MDANPLISIFTPTRRAAYLSELWDSIVSQRYGNIEWVILPNNGLTRAEVEAVVPGSLRIRVLDSVEAENIGELKRIACDNCRGAMFLEADYDDLLVPDTLPRVVQAWLDGAGFIYSDAAVFQPDLSSWSYSPVYGWEHYDIEVYGRTYKATRCFDLHPRMLAEVYYAPDHLRCWSREAYYAAGGHDKSLFVCDDHDLICRTYLTGAEFKHIGGCGYLYQWHDGNTVPQRQQAIIRQNALNRDKYLPGLIAEWCRRDPRRLVVDLPRSDAPLRELMRKHEYKQLVMSHLIVKNVLQFMQPESQAAFFTDACRWLAPGGFLSIEVPSESGRFAGMNPLHRTRFNLNSFLFYTDRLHQPHLSGAFARFQPVSLYEFYPNQSYKDLDMAVIRADLMKLDDSIRQPGLKQI